MERKWYQQTWAIILLLWFFFPVGLYLMWRHASWRNIWKWGVTGSIAAFVALLVLAAALPAEESDPLEGLSPEEQAYIEAITTQEALAAQEEEARQEEIAAQEEATAWAQAAAKEEEERREEERKAEEAAKEEALANEDVDDEDDNNAAGVGALEMAEVAFVGDYDQREIKQRLDTAMSFYGLEITEENYLRAASVLVALRKEYGPSEMEILDYMIRSYVPGVAMSFPDMAALSVVILAAGDQ